MAAEFDRLNPDVFWAEIAPPAHIAQFYDNGGVLVDTLVRFVGGGLKAGESTIVIATAKHLNALEQGLTQKGVNVAAARAGNCYTGLLADAVLSTFMVNDWPDDRLFFGVVEGLIKRARAKGSRVRAFGEMVAILWAKGHTGATVHLEHLWNQLCKKQDFSLLCAYPKPGFTEDPTESLAKICAAHSQVF
ncbi:MAG: MEDS domain-containing protein [Candidatus Acidiferrales bacterium]